MEELVSKLTEKAGVDPDMAVEVVEFLKEHTDELPGWLARAGLKDKLPGAAPRAGSRAQLRPV
jgi:hypothetical protein